MGSEWSENRSESYEDKNEHSSSIRTEGLINRDVVKKGDALSCHVNIKCIVKKDYTYVHHILIEGF